MQDKLTKEKIVLGSDLSVTSSGIGSLPLSDDLLGPSGLSYWANSRQNTEQWRRQSRENLSR